MKQIVFGNFKGGTGKTSVLFNIGALLAKDYGKKVLMIDVDPQANLTSYFNISANMPYTGYDNGYPEGMNILNIFDAGRIKTDLHYLGRRYMLDELVYANVFPEIENLDILPGHMDLNFSADALLRFAQGEDGYERANRILYDFLHAPENIDKTNEYDYIFIDTNPYINVLAVNAMYGGASTIAVSDVGTYSLRGVDMFNKCQVVYLNLDPREVHYSAVILNQVEMRTIATQNAIFLAEQRFGDKLVRSYIPKTTLLKDAEQSHKPVCLYYKPGDKLYDSFTKLVNELISKGVL